MQVESTGDISQPVRLVCPVGPELHQQWFQFVARWQRDLGVVLAGVVHRTMLLRTALLERNHDASLCLSAANLGYKRDVPRAKTRGHR